MSMPAIASPDLLLFVNVLAGVTIPPSFELMLIISITQQELFVKPFRGNFTGPAKDDTFGSHIRSISTFVLIQPAHMFYSAG